MTNKEPKTLKGMQRKFWTGDGRTDSKNPFVRDILGIKDKKRK